MTAAASPHHCTNPQRIRIDNHHKNLGSIWQSAAWRKESAAYRARTFPYCPRCGRVARIVPGHSGEDYGPGMEASYIKKVRRDQVEPLCHKCNREESKGKHPCPECIVRHREDPDHYIRYIGQHEELCWSCEHGGDGVAPLRKKRHYNRHSCGWHSAGQSCTNPLRRSRVCDYSRITAPLKCDPAFFMPQQRAAAGVT